MASALRLRLVVGAVAAARPRRLEWPRNADDDLSDADDGRRAATGARAVTDAMLGSFFFPAGVEWQGERGASTFVLASRSSAWFVLNCRDARGVARRLRRGWTEGIGRATAADGGDALRGRCGQWERGALIQRYPDAGIRGNQTGCCHWMARRAAAGAGCHVGQGARAKWLVHIARVPRFY